jgi:hypothetical protein
LINWHLFKFIFLKEGYSSSVPQKGQEVGEEQLFLGLWIVLKVHTGLPIQIYAGLLMVGDLDRTGQKKKYRSKIKGQ